MADCTNLYAIDCAGRLGTGLLRFFRRKLERHCEPQSRRVDCDNTRDFGTAMGVMNALSRPLFPGPLRYEPDPAVCNLQYYTDHSSTYGSSADEHHARRPFS
jgi:hypothetical protein